MGKIFKIFKRKTIRLKQEIHSIYAVNNLIDFLIDNDYQKIFINFCYYDDDEKPSIIIGGLNKSIERGYLKNILLHPDISKRETIEYFPFINSCFNLAKKISIFGRKNSEFYSEAYENQNVPSPYLDYKMISKPKEIFDFSDKEFVLFKFENLEKISFGDNRSNDLRKPHLSFYNLLSLIKKNISIRYYKFITNGLDFYISSKSSSNINLDNFSNPIDHTSPFQEFDPLMSRVRGDK